MCLKCDVRGHTNLDTALSTGIASPCLCWAKLEGSRAKMVGIFVIDFKDFVRL